MEEEEGRSSSHRRQLCTSLCGLNNTERQDSAKQKRNRKRPMESSFEKPRVSLVLPHPSTHPRRVTQVSPPCSAAYQVKSRSCQRGSQVGNVLFRTPYSLLRVGRGCKVMEPNCFLTSGPAQKLGRQYVGLVGAEGERRL